MITYPGASVADVQVIPALLRRKLGARFFRDKVPEYRLWALEVTRLIGKCLPVGDIARLSWAKTAIRQLLPSSPLEQTGPILWGPRAGAIPCLVVALTSDLGMIGAQVRLWLCRKSWSTIQVEV